MLRVYEERLAEIVGSTGKWPPAHQDGGMWEKLKAILTRFWRSITGQPEGVEPTVKNLQDSFKLLREGARRRINPNYTSNTFGKQPAITSKEEREGREIGRAHV